MIASGTSIGRYLVRGKLAEGGMAEIYLASAVGAEGFAKDVVIKVVHPFLGTDPQFVEMFIAEARLASRLNHANVVQIFDFGKYEERYFLAMEYVRGASLARLRKRCRELGVAVPPTLAAEICAHVARGLHYAHTVSESGRCLGVVHRDVTPQNVLLSFDGAVKLSDFGIAKVTTTHTAPGMLKGKFAYMSPEQARGERIDARSDIFSLGIVLWEMLTGGRLFSGDSDVSVLRAVQSEAIAPPSELNRDVPPALSEVVMKALSRLVEGRFQSAFEVERALATFVLHSAKTVEDSSVSDFLHLVFRGEFEHQASLEPPLVTGGTDGYSTGGADLLDGQRVSPGTVTVTPSGLGPARASSLPGELARVDGTAEPRRPSGSSSARRTSPVPSGDSTLDPEVGRGRGRGRTDRIPVPGRVSTALMPRLGLPPSRRLAPFPSAEPSVLVKSGGRTEAPEGQNADRERLAFEEDLLGGRPHRPLLPYLWGSLAALAIASGFLAYTMWPDDGGTSRHSGPIDTRAEPSAERQVTPPDVRPPVVEEATKPSTGVVAPAPTEEALGIKPTTAEHVKLLPAPPMKKEPVVRPVPRMGRLTVNVIPFALVRANGRQLGEAYGLETYQLRPGTYDIELEHPRRRMRSPVTINPNEEVRLVFNALE